MASARLSSSVRRMAGRYGGEQSIGKMSTRLSPSLRTLSSVSNVATTSQVTLAHHSQNQIGFRSSNLLSTIKKQRYHLNSIGRVRSMATITRQPEQPEDPEVFAGNAEPTIIISDSASNHLEKVSKKENNPDLALRISVEPGGCHGYQYKMELTDEMEEDDFRFSIKDKNVHILIDSTSLRLIKGSTIDYVTELIGSQFAIFNNPQAKGSGCGCGVSWEPNI